MNYFEQIKLAIANIKSNMLRTVLTMSIIAFGIMALVGILTAIDAILLSMNSSMSGLGANSFAIAMKDSQFNKGRRGMREKVGDPITLSDAMDFYDRYKLAGSISISGGGPSAATVVFNNNKTNPNISILGINEEYLKVEDFKIAMGRAFSANDYKFGSNVCMIGSDIVKRLFAGNESYALDKYVSIGGNKFKVVGTIESKGASMTSNTDKQMYIPLLTQKKYYGYEDQNYSLKISNPANLNLQSSIDYATGLFRQVRRLKISEADNFEIQKSDAMMKMLEENTAIIRTATIGIGLITLLGAAIGLMNIMMVSVQERTKEIGIRKALGASQKIIRIQFLMEAILICQLGGIVGIILGIIAGNFISFFTGSAFYVPWFWITLGFLICLAVGLFAGLYPAIKASRLDPVESLRYE